MRMRRVLFALATALSVALATAVLLAPRSGSASVDSSPSLQSATMGEWSAPLPWPIIGVHAALLLTGKVLQFSYPQGGQGSAAGLWDPTTGAFQATAIDRNIFCGGQSFLPDGRLLVTGGALQGDVEGAGVADTHIFDPSTEEWTRVRDMAVARWYPTNVTLPDGRALVFAGNDEQGQPTPLVELYDPGSGMQPVPSATRYMSTYPRMHLLPSGKIFHAGPEQFTTTLDTNTFAWEAVGLSSYGFRGGGTSVLLPLQPPDYHPKVMIMGGGNPATDTAEIIDLGDPAPTWGSTASMNQARRNLNAVILPDGQVLVVGGGATGQTDDPVYEAEIFDPVSETWTPVAGMQRPRVYHSTAILLPDGRVLSAGSDGEFTAEIYSPPYLFQGSRPQISSAPNVAFYGSDLEISTTDAQGIAQVVLIRPASVTHSVNMEQRYVGLNFQIGTDQLMAQIPASQNLAAPGYHMLFIVDSDGVPSEATFIQLQGAVGGIAELPEVDQLPLRGSDRSGIHYSVVAAIAAGAAAFVMAARRGGRAGEARVRTLEDTTTDSSGKRGHAR